MPRERTLEVQFPRGGVVRRFAYPEQPPFTTPDAKNVWPTQWVSGREQGGVRPGLASVSGVSSLGTAANWCPAVWYASSALHRGAAIATTSGAWTVESDATDTQQISQTCSSGFQTVAVLNQVLFLADAGATTVYKNLNTAATGSLTTTGWPTTTAGCGIVVAALDRLFAAASPTNPNIVYASAIGNGLDMDTTAALGASKAYATGGSRGVINEAVTSLIPHSSGCLLIGCLDSTYIIRGNLEGGGELDQISSTLGPLMQSAWCQDGQGNTWMFTRDGLYRLSKGCGLDPLESVSRERLPDELVAIDPGGGDTLAMGYDRRFRGIHISAKIDSVESSWFFDMQNANGGFWPCEYGAAVQCFPQVAGLAASSTSVSEVMPIISGTAKQFDRSSTSESIDSYLWLGPFKMGQGNQEGILTAVDAVLAADESGYSTDAGTIAWEIYTGDSPQEAYNSSAAFTGTSWSTDALNFTQNPCVTGNAFYIKLIDSSNSRWTVPDEITLTINSTGRRLVG